ncbi:hypothetical protein CDAR_458631 [Caerostris darwini]|uniref:Uncharacterized protein n=1 Tax=Caerostris darwini TaxID=1538125 RepID=A0AAV4VBZ9_9ARAC|nr:hypothetical protein CDAR_458631 [Caerostris darwini]
MDENLRGINQYLEYKFEKIENSLFRASNVFNRLEQAVFVHTALDPETLTADECRAREPESTILINRLQNPGHLKHLNIELKFPLFNFDNRQQVIERIILEGNGLNSGNMALCHMFG